MKSIQTTIIASLCAIILVFSGIQIAEATHLKKAEEPNHQSHLESKPHTKYVAIRYVPK